MSRERWLKGGKEPGHERHSTRAEFCAVLGVSDATFERAVRAGDLPAPAVRQESNGWRLWSPAQVTAAIKKRARLG